MRKKLCFFIKSLGVGGTERVLIAYLRGLVKEDKYDITLIINRSSEVNVLLNDVPKEVKIVYVLNEKYDKFIENISLKRKRNKLYRVIYGITAPLNKNYREKFVKNFIEKEKIDIFVDFERTFVKCAEKFKCKKILWNHFTFSKMSKSEKEKWVERFDKYNKIIAISNEMLEEIESFYDNVEKVSVLYNPQNFDKIIEGSLNKENLSEEELNLLDEDYITYVGRIEKIKGLEDLIYSYNKVNKRVKEKLYIIGSGKELESLKKIVDDYKLNEKILFLGSKNNPFIWMKNAKLFVTTTYGEGLPTTYIESMICGTPVLSYDCPTGPKDILGMGKYGCLVKMGDKDEFSNQLENLLINKMEIESYKIKMKEKLDDFKIETVIKKFKTIIDNI